MYLVCKTGYAMELKWLEDFLSLCDTGNFRVSSERRCVSQPAFSRRIKALENWVGATLIDRSGQPVTLTAAGETFKPVALEMAQLAWQSRDDIKAQAKADACKLSFSTLSTLAQFFLPGWLKDLQPQIETRAFSVRTDFGSFDDYLDGLEAGLVDFFICYQDPSGTIRNYTDKFQSIQLGTERLVPVVNPDTGGRPTIWLPDAAPGSVIPYLQTDASPTLWPVRHHRETHYRALEFEPVYETSIATALRAMVIEGYGMAWIPESIVASDLKEGRLVRAAGEDDDIPMDIQIFRYAENAEPKTETFWQALLQNTANQGPDP